MNREGKDGFTLLELVASMLILGLVMTVVAGVLGLVVRSERIEQTVDADTLAGEVDELIADDLAFLVVPTGRGPITIIEQPDGNSTLAFYSAAGAKAAWGEMTTPLHLITYSVELMSRGGEGLFRSEEPVVASDEAYYDAPLLVAGGVTEFRAEAFDGVEWHTRWPEGDTGPLPLLVRVTCTFGADAARQRTVFVESAPPVEYVIKPQAQRRASGGASGGGESESDGGEGDDGDEGEG